VAVIENGALGGTQLHHGSYAVRALHASARLHGEFFKGKKYGIDADLFTDSLMQWMKAQRAASNRLARDLQKDLENLDVWVALGRGTLIGPGYWRGVCWCDDKYTKPRGRAGGNPERSRLKSGLG
jgi:pyruvate/2-oxoglutarate dehydrogenase complex dihydrolipoamide dehydrogenase (E3) component